MPLYREYAIKKRVDLNPEAMQEIAKALSDNLYSAEHFKQEFLHDLKGIQQISF